MDCNCKSGKFWLGLGLGSLLGMIAYHCAKSDRAKIWKDKVSCAAQSAADKAGEWVTGVKDCSTKKEE